MSTKPKRVRRRSQHGSRATDHDLASRVEAFQPTETTPPITELPPLTDELRLKEELGARPIMADQDHPLAVQQRWDELALQKAEKGARHGAKFSGGRQARGDLWQVLDAIVRDRDWQHAPWPRIMHESAKRLHNAEVRDNHLSYEDPPGRLRSINHRSFQAKLAAVRRFLKKVL